MAAQVAQAISREAGVPLEDGRQGDGAITLAIGDLHTDGIHVTQDQVRRGLKDLRTKSKRIKRLREEAKSRMSDWLAAQEGQ